MTIKRLDHYSIRTTDVDATRDFYTNVMGLSVGPRPNFPFPGVWLYQNDIAVVHVIGAVPRDQGGLMDYLGDKATGAVEGTGNLDHVAFLGSDFEGMRAKFQDANVPYRERKVPDLDLMQLFIRDPNGVTIELNFPL